MSEIKLNCIKVKTAYELIQRHHKVVGETLLTVLYFSNNKHLDYVTGKRHDEDENDSSWLVDGDDYEYVKDKEGVGLSFDEFDHQLTALVAESVEKFFNSH